MSTALDEELVRRTAELMAAATTGMAIKEPDGPYLWANDAYRAMHALGPIEVMGRRDCDLFPPPLAARRRERELRVGRTGAAETFADEVGGAVVDGELLRLSADGGHGLLGVICHAPAPTVHRPDQLILDAVGDPLFVLDSAGAITFANRAATALLGRPEADLLGTPLTALLRPRSARDAVERTLRDGTLRRSTDGSIRLDDDSELAVECTAGRIGDGEGNGDGDGDPHAVVTLRDVSAWRRAAVEAQENERRAIAAEIHDDTVQVMSAVGLRLERAAAHAEPAAAAALDELRATVREATDRLRHLLFNLTPPALAIGTGRAIEALAVPLGEREGFAVEIRDTLEEQPPMDIRLLVYRIAQEALLNVAKHAHARSVRVGLEHERGGVRLTVEDDGAGAPAEAMQQSAPGHLGVSVMRHRAQLAGGALTISAAPGRGTTVEAWLPLGAPESQP